VIDLNRLVPNTPKDRPDSRWDDTHVLCNSKRSKTACPGLSKAPVLGWVTGRIRHALRGAPTPVCAARPRWQKQGGRTVEIQRFIVALPARRCADAVPCANAQITIDCDVLQADGGTRCAVYHRAVWVGIEARGKQTHEGRVDVIQRPGWLNPVAAISCGIYAGQAPCSDLDLPRGSEAA